MTKKKLSGILAAILAALFGWKIADSKPPVVVPSPTPTPVASASPTPGPLPTPSPLPTIPVCGLPASSGSCVFPPVIPAEFERDVEAAQLEAETAGFVSNGKVKDENLYVREVARILRTLGYCATQGLTVKDEVWVKKSNDFSEHWDIVSSSQQPLSIYAARCSKAAF